MSDSSKNIAMQKLSEMIDKDPLGEIHFLRLVEGGTLYRGYLSWDGILYYAAMQEVDLDKAA